MTAIIANNAVFYGFMVLQSIIELITTEGDAATTCDITINGAPFSHPKGDAAGANGFAFNGGSAYAEFQLVVTITTDAQGGGDEVYVTFGREAVFDARYMPLEPPLNPFEFQRHDLTADHLSKAQCPFRLALDSEALPLVAWLIYTLFVEYHLSVAALEEDHRLGV